MSKVQFETVEVRPAIPAVVKNVYTVSLTEHEAVLVSSLLGKCNSVGSADNAFDLWSELDDALSNNGVSARFDVRSGQGNSLSSLRVDK